MALWIALVALYVLQCGVWLPPGSVAFVRPLGRWLRSEGPGWVVLPLRPSGAARLAMRLPLVEVDGALHGSGADGPLSGPSAFGAGAAVEPSALAAAEARARTVRLGPLRLARAFTDEQAEARAAWLRALGRAPAAARPGLVEAALARALSLARYHEAQQRVERATRLLRPACDGYAVALFAVMPALGVLVGAERALWLGLPALAALHIATLAALVLAFRRLQPGRPGALAELLLGTALYPPLLLRTVHELRTRSLADFHPAAVGAAVLPRAAARDLLRAEIVRATARAETSARDGAGIDALTCRALWALAGELGESPESLLAAPARQDALAASYCPACVCEYRCASGTCSDCAVALRPWPVPA